MNNFRSNSDTVIDDFLILGFENAMKTGSPYQLNTA